MDVSLFYSPIIFSTQFVCYKFIQYHSMIIAVRQFVATHFILSTEEPLSIQLQNLHSIGCDNILLFQKIFFRALSLQTTEDGAHASFGIGALHLQSLRTDDGRKERAVKRCMEWIDEWRFCQQWDATPWTHIFWRMWSWIEERSGSACFVWDGL